MSFFPSSPHPLDDSHTPLPSAVGTPGTSLQPYSTSAFALPSASGLDPADIPITRSRTLYYLSVRDSTTTRARSRRYYPGATSEYGYDGGSVGDARFGGRGAEEETAGLMDAPVGREGDYTLDIQRAGLPPKWVDTMEQVDDILEKTKSKLGHLEKLHAKHVLPAFTDRSAEEREIEASTVSITRDLRKMQSLIQEIRPPATGADKNEITTTRNVQRALAARIQDLSAAFRKKQKVYMQQLQGHAIKNKDLLTASGAITLKGPERFEELEEDIQASHAQLSQTQRQKTRNQGSSATETVIRQRDREITHLAHSIADLGDLFRDMANLVVEQGTVLDSVEYNVEVAAREVKGAVDELGVAQSYQRRTGKRKCILLLVLIIVGLILVLIYKPRGGPPHVPPPSPSSLHPPPVLANEEDIEITSVTTTPAAEGMVPSATRHYTTLHPSAPRIRPPSLPKPRPSKSRRPRPSRSRSRALAAQNTTAE